MFHSHLTTFKKHAQIAWCTKDRAEGLIEVLRTAWQADDDGDRTLRRLMQCLAAPQKATPTWGTSQVGFGRFNPFAQQQAATTTFDKPFAKTFKVPTDISQGVVFYASPIAVAAQIAKHPLFRQAIAGDDEMGVRWVMLSLPAVLSQRQKQWLDVFKPKQLPDKTLRYVLSSEEYQLLIQNKMVGNHPFFDVQIMELSGALGVFADVMFSDQLHGQTQPYKNLLTAKAVLTVLTEPDTAPQIPMLTRLANLQAICRKEMFRLQAVIKGAQYLIDIEPSQVQPNPDINKDVLEGRLPCFVFYPKEPRQAVQFSAFMLQLGYTPAIEQQPLLYDLLESEQGLNVWRFQPTNMSGCDLTPIQKRFIEDSHRAMHAYQQD